MLLMGTGVPITVTCIDVNKRMVLSCADDVPCGTMMRKAGLGLG